MVGVEVGPQEDALSRQVDLIDDELRHGARATASGYSDRAM
jgi:hypothetical protein